MRVESQNRTHTVQPDMECSLDEVSTPENLCLDILMAINEGVIGFNVNNLICFINDSAVKLLGYEKSELIGKNLRKIFPNEAVFTTTIESTSSWAEQSHLSLKKTVFKIKSGSNIHCEISTAVVTSLNQEQRLYFWIIRDITEHVSLEKELRNKNHTLNEANMELIESKKKYEGKVAELEHLYRQLEESIIELRISETKFRRLIQTAVDAVITITDDSNILLFNKAAERVFGYTSEEMIGEPITRIIPCLHCKVCKKAFTGCFDNWIKNALGKIKDISAVRKNGETFPVELSLSDMTIEGERTLTTIIRDITDKEFLKRKLEEKTRQLELANLELEEANKLKSEFLANASHELRTPLNSMIGFLRLNLDGLCQSKEEEQEFIQNALDSSYHLLSLINDILDISKIEAGKMTLDLEKIEPEKIFNDLYILTHIQAQQKGLQLVFTPPKRSSTCVRADYNKLKQILLNLIGNAIKFTEKGEIIVSAQAHPKKGFVKFSVKDNGIGVSSEKMKKLFKKFVQGDGSTTRKYGGTGLGLTITKSLVELMGGIIQMRSEGEGKGTTVHFTVPIYTSNDSLFEKSIPDTELKEATTSEEPLILIVEDDPIIRSLIEDILKQQDFNTICAVTADDAVAIARKSHPAVITLDFGLLAREHAVLQNGWDIVSVLSKDNETKDIKFIIISGYDEPIKERIREENLDFQPEFLEKPFDANVLIEKINNLLTAEAPSD